MLRKFILGAVVLLGASTAQAGPRVRMRLDYEQGPQVCPDAMGFRGALRRQFGYDPIDARADDALAVRVSQHDDRVVARGTFYRAGAAAWTLERDATMTECRALLDVVALSTRIRLDPPGRAEPAAAGPTETPALPQRDARPAPVQRKWAAGLLLGAVLWERSAIAPAPGLSWGLRAPWYSVGMEGRVVVPVDAGPFSTGVGYVSAIPCLHWRALYGCAVASIGVAWINSLPGSQQTPYLAAGGRLGVEIPIAPRLAGLVASDISVSSPIVRHVDGVEHRFPFPAIGSGTVGVITQF